MVQHKDSMSGNPIVDSIVFFTRFLASPSRIGSVIPSSSFLAEKMVKPEDLAGSHCIIELGAGTGVFTRRLMKMKDPGANLYVFEKDPVLAHRLKERFPNIRLFTDAAKLDELYTRGEILQPDLVISGLPFAVFPPSERSRILRGVYRVLRPGGTFVTFQYSFQLLKELKNTFESVDLDFVLWNIPPAVIYRCTKGSRQT